MKQLAREKREKKTRKIHVTKIGRSQEQTSMHFNWSKEKKNHDFSS